MMYDRNGVFSFIVRKVAVCGLIVLSTLIRPVSGSEISCRLRNLQPGNIFYIGQPVGIGLEISGIPQKEKIGISYSVKNYYGKEVLKKEIEMENTGVVEILLFENPETSGYFVVPMEIEVNGQVVSNVVGSLCIIEPPQPEDKKFLWGLWAPNLIYYFSEDPIQAFKRMGVDWIPFLVHWDKIEPQENKFIWENEKDPFDGWMKKIKEEYGLNSMVMIDFPPEWAVDRTDSDTMRAFDLLPKAGALSDFIYTFVNRYKDYVKIWAPLYDEPEGRIKGRESRYIELMKVAYDAAKKADPDCIISGGELSEASERRSFPDTLYKDAKNYFDVFTFHPYASRRKLNTEQPAESPEDMGLDTILDHFVSISREYTGGRKPAFPTAIGWEFDMALVKEGDFNNKLLRQQANFLVQAFAIARTRDVKGLFWFIGYGLDRYSIFAGKGPGGSWKFCQPLPAAVAYSTTLQYLKNVDKGTMISLGNGVTGCVFGKGRGSVAVLWAKNNGFVELNSRKEMSEISIAGVRKGPYTGESKICIGEEPVFLEFPDTGFSDVKATIQNAKTSFSPVEFALFPADISALDIRVSNKTERARSGTVEVTSAALGVQTAKKIRLDRMSSKKDYADIQVPVSNTGPLTDKGGEVTVSFKTRWDTYREKYSLKYIPVFYNERIKIDGALSDWPDSPTVELNTEEYAYPKSTDAGKKWTGPDDLSVKLCLAYDKSYLYLSARVKDDSFAQKFTGPAIWRGDMLHVAFVNGFRVPFQWPDFEYGIALTSEGVQVYKWFEQEQKNGFVSSVKASVKRNNGITIYEAAIPQKDLLPLQLQAGKVFGFNFVVMDADEDKPNAGYRWLGLTPGIAGGKDASVFKSFVLMGENK